MTPEFFLVQLQLSTTSAIEFGSRYITNAISENIRYNIEFNQSNDEHVGGSFSIYPGDNGRVARKLSKEEVVVLLCRNGKVPAWIDISIGKSSAQSTQLKLSCSGRYTDRIEEMYYVEGGAHPFGIKSPRFPPGNIHPGSKDVLPFRLYDKYTGKGRILNFLRNAIMRQLRR